MTPETAFPEIVSLIRLARRPGDFDNVSRLASKLTANEILALRTGLEIVLTDQHAFDELFDLFLRLPGEPDACEPEFDRNLKQRILDRGVGDLRVDQLVQLASAPAWLAELRDALLEPVPHPYWAAVAADYRPQPATASSGATGEQIRAEVDSALDLLGHPLGLNPRKVVDWVYARLTTGRRPDATDTARRVLTQVAEAIRDTRAPGRAVLAPDGSTLQRWADARSVVDWATGCGPLATAVAAASRGLSDDDDPDASDLFVLAVYAGRTDAELADLFRTDAATIAGTREGVVEIVRAEVQRALGAHLDPSGDAPVPPGGAVPTAGRRLQK